MMVWFLIVILALLTVALIYANEPRDEDEDE